MDETDGCPWYAVFDFGCFVADRFEDGERRTTGALDANRYSEGFATKSG